MLDTLSPNQLRSLLSRFEPPDCLCPLVRRHKPAPEGCDGSCDPDAWCDCCLGLCECPPEPYQEPCWHVRTARRHGLTMRRWAVLLALADPEEYADPVKTPAAPAVALTRLAREAVYTGREGRGEQLYHPSDLWRRVADPRLRIGPAILKLANGEPEPDSTALAGEGPPSCEPELLWDEGMLVRLAKVEAILEMQQRRAAA